MVAPCGQEDCGHTIEKLVKALELAEWGGSVAAGQLTCPVCRFGNRDGHDPDCKLADAIKEAS